MTARVRLACSIALVGAPLACALSLTDCSRTSDATTAPAGEAASITLNLRASLSPWADAPLTLRDPLSGMTLMSRLRGSRHRPAEKSRDQILFRDAMASGADIAFRATPNGAEDFITLPSPEITSLAYELTLDSHVAGLRLVANSLELLDARGYPRLRVQSPYLRDSSKKRLPIALSIEGCDVSTSPAPPFDRPVTSPKSTTCILHLDWNSNAARYPIVVDPGWMTTDALSTARFEHVAVLLANGNVMVAGGQTGDPTSIETTTASTEIYSGGVWAASGDMKGDRAIAAAATLSNGNIFVTGGLSQIADGTQTILGTSEIYDVASGTWSTTGSLTNARSGHTATAVGDGTILVAGGYDNSGDHYDSAELYSAGVFSSAGNINTSRFDHFGVTLSGNRVLLGGGTNAFSGALASIELYTAGTGWAAASTLASMSTPRLLMSAAGLPNGDVVFIGGYNDADGPLGSAETYHPATNTWSTATGTMIHPRYHAAAAALSTGQILVVGGEDGNGNYRDAELFDPATSQFSDFCGMSVASAYGHSATLLTSGAVLVAGGHGYSPSRLLSSASIFDLSVDAGGLSSDGGFVLEDAGACDHPLVIALDSGSLTDASDDAAAPAVDSGSTDFDADVDASGAGQVSGSSDASTSEEPTGGIAAGGGCSQSGHRRSGDRGSNPVFFAGFAIMSVLIRSRRWHHFARRFRPFF